MPQLVQIATFHVIMTHFYSKFSPYYGIMAWFRLFMLVHAFLILDYKRGYTNNIKFLAESCLVPVAHPWSECKFHMIFLLFS